MFSTYVLVGLVQSSPRGCWMVASLVLQLIACHRLAGSQLKLKFGIIVIVWAQDDMIVTRTSRMNFYGWFSWDSKYLLLQANKQVPKQAISTRPKKRKKCYQRWRKHRRKNCLHCLHCLHWRNDGMQDSTCRWLSPICVPIQLKRFSICAFREHDPGVLAWGPSSNYFACSKYFAAQTCSPLCF